jgi:hypothetical protein
MKNLTKFRLSLGLAATGICLLLSFTVAPVNAAGKPSRNIDAVTRLTNENKILSQNLFRAEAKVKALRKEADAFDPVAIIGGLGWIVGIFGGVAWFKSREKA